MPTVENLLSIYRVRCECQREGVTNPHPKIKVFCIQLVEALEKEEPNAQVEFIYLASGQIDFVCDERVLATRPANDEIVGWESGHREDFK